MLSSRLVNATKQIPLKSIAQSISQTLDKATGYETITFLKTQVDQKQSNLSTAKQALANAKQTFQESTIAKKNIQSQINTLLHRKQDWSNADVELFAQLYKRDKQADSNEQEARDAFQKASDAFDAAHEEYLDSVKERYVGEALYSDKIRQARYYASNVQYLVDCWLDLCTFSDVFDC